MKNWTSKGKPVVSICCTTYNHENYINDALDGFLMQKTDFPFEIIVRDDCSTDKTAIIIKQYIEKYPNIVNPIFETENQFSKGVKPMPIVYNKATGEYFALCEGDDYWTDHLKLQKQVGFLEKNNSFSMCGTKYYKKKVGGQVANNAGNYSIEDILMGNRVGTLTILFRSKYLTKPALHFIKNKPFGDWPLLIVLAKNGNSTILNDITGVYRVHESGIYSSMCYFKQRLLTYKSIEMFFKDQYFTEKEKLIIYKSGKKELKNILQLDFNNHKKNIESLLDNNNFFISKYEKIILKYYLERNEGVFKFFSKIIFIPNDIYLLIDRSIKYVFKKTFNNKYC